MAIRHALWVAGEAPLELETISFDDEAELEDMIVAAPRILSDDWMLIGRQVRTKTGSRADLLAMAPDASLILVELKRHRTTREVVAQALDYASWVRGLDAEQVANIYRRFKPKADLAQDFENRFGHKFDESEVNNAHQIVVVAAELDASTKRIVGYLEHWGVPIKVLSFQVFAHNNERFVSRTCLIDPAEVQVSASTSSDPKEPWDGDYYANFGHSKSRDWGEARKHGFISAGGGGWYSRTLNAPEGARVWVKVPGTGFVGVGTVAGPRQIADDFEIDGRPALEVLEAEYHRDEEDPDKREHFVPVEWLHTVELDKAVAGAYGNQNTVCQPRTPKWRATVKKLKNAWPEHSRR